MQEPHTRTRNTNNKKGVDYTQTQDNWNNKQVKPMKPISQTGSLKKINYQNKRGGQPKETNPNNNTDKDENMKHKLMKRINTQTGKRALFPLLIPLHHMSQNKSCRLLNTN